MRAEVLAGSDRIDEARALLEKARDTHPDRAEPWSALIVLAERRGKGEESPRCSTRPRRGSATASNSGSPAPATGEPGGPDVSEKLRALAGSLDKFEPASGGDCCVYSPSCSLEAGTPRRPWPSGPTTPTSTRET